MYKIVIVDAAKKDLKRIPLQYRKKIGKQIDALAENPFAGKKLEGELDGVRGLRVWPYRVLYIVEKRIVTVTVVHVGHRQGVYK